MQADGANGVLTGEGVIVRGADGRAVLRCDSVVVRAPEPWGDLRRWEVTLSGVKADLVRGEDGRWNLEDLLPRRVEKRAAETPYVIRILDAEVSLEDRMAGEEADWGIRLAGVEAHGVGDSATLRGRLTLEGEGGAVFAITAGPDGLLSAFVRTDGLRVSRLKRYLQSLPEFIDAPWLNVWDAEEANFAGEVRFEAGFGETRTDFSLTGSGSAAVSGLRVYGKTVRYASFDGVFSDRALSGKWTASATGLDAEATGSVVFGEELQVRLDGRLEANSESALKEWTDDLLPDEVAFRGAIFKGSIEYGETLVAAGRVSAESASWSDYSAQNLTAGLITDGRALRLSDVEGNVFGSDAVAALAVTFGEEPHIEGYVEARNVSLGLIPTLPKEQVLSGNIHVKVLMEGDLSSPRLLIHAGGHADLLMRSKDFTVVETMDLQARGELYEGTLTILAAELTGPSGSLRGSGTVGLAEGDLDLRLVANTVDIGAIPVSPAGGTAYADLVVTGTTKSPEITGRAEIYSASVGIVELPFAGAVMGWHEGILTLTDVTARSGVSLLTGSLEVAFGEEGYVSGEGEVLDLGIAQFTQTEAFPDGLVQGLAEGTWRVSGTLDAPVVEASLSGEGLIVDRVPVAHAEARGRWDAGELRLDELVATLAGGTLRAEGSFTPGGPGRLRFSVHDLPAEAIAPYSGPGAQLSGTLAADGEVQFKEGRAETGSVQVTFEEIELNGEMIGSGSMSADYQSGRVRASGGLGSLEGYYVLEEAEYDVESGELEADLSVLNLGVAQAFRVLGDALEGTLSYSVRNQLGKLDGRISLAGGVWGNAKNWPPESMNLDVFLSADDLQLDRRHFGRVQVRARREDAIWTYSQAEWIGGPATFRLTPGAENRFEEGGEIQLDGEISNVDLSWLKYFDPRFGDLSGTLDIPFIVSGSAQAPEIALSVSGSDIRYGEFSAEGLNIGSVLIREGEIILEAGALEVRRFVAILTEARIPFNYPMNFPRDEPISATIEVPERDINDLSRFFGGLDTEVTEGGLSRGTLAVSGTLQEISLDGSISAYAKTLKFAGFDPVFTDVTFRIGIVGDVVEVEAVGSGDEGGFEARAAVDWREGAIVGSAYLKSRGLFLRHKTEEGIEVRARINADLTAAGSVLEPLVEGVVVASRGLADLAGEFPEPDAPVHVPFNPFFNIEMRVEPSRFRRGLLNSLISGHGELSGSLDQIDVRMEFQVQEGEIALPSGRIRLERGGRGEFRYGRTWRGEGQASLNVNLRATTQVTAPSGLGIQRYRINLLITGDLLSDQELFIEATSEPAGLTQDEIMGLLGQRQFFEQIAGAATGNFETQLKDVLTTVAAPVVLAPVTRTLERSFGLDYVYLDFSQGGLGMLVLAKSLWAGFSLEYRRSLRNEVASESFDRIQLTYRPQTRNPLLAQLSTALAYDRFGVWRLTFGLSRRF